MMQEQTTIDHDGLGSVDCYKLYGYNWDQCGYCRGRRRASSNGASQQQQLQKHETGEEDDNSHSAGAPHPRHNTHRGGSNNNDTYRSYLTKLDSPLRPASYEALMCRGWRRSGTIVYKPDNAVTCCPQHTIRLPLADFVPNKEQKKVLRKMQSLLGQEEKEKRSSNGGGGSKNGNHNNERPKKHELKDAVMAFLARNGVIASLARETETHLTHLLQGRDCRKETIPPVRYKLHGLTNGSNTTSIAASLACPICPTLVAQKVIEKRAASDLASRLVQRMQESSPVLSSSDVIVVSSMTFTTAGMLRVEVKVPHEALADHRSTSTTTNNGRPRAVDPLAAWFQGKGLSVPTNRAIRIQTLPATESAATDPRVHQLYWDYQEAVHGDTHPLKSNNAVATSPSPSSSVAATTTTSATTTTTNDEHHHSGTRGASTLVDVRALPMLEKTYGGSSSSSSPLAGTPVPRHAFAAFWDFLVHSPLGTSTVHQLYTVGEALVAVGVLDILPTGVSSVYCFYDPTFTKLVPLGTYTAVREIEYTRSLQLPYYYLGYYIESNPKMNYKGDYIGSQIRCTATGEWVGVDDARKVLRRDERARFGTGTSSNPHSATVDVGSLPILTNQGIIYGNFLQDEDKEYFYPFLEEWVSLVGPDVAVTGTVDIRE